MRHFISILLIGFSLLSYGQEGYDEWTAIPIVDEFGDSVGDTAMAYVTMGTFSNSATSNSELAVRVSRQGGAFFIELFEYGRQPQASLGGLDGAFGDIKVKREDGSVEEFNVFAAPAGGILIRQGTKLARLLEEGEGEAIRFLIYENKFSRYGSSSYNFSIETL